jgi:hypothetical protein
LGNTWNWNWRNSFSIFCTTRNWLLSFGVFFAIFCKTILLQLGCLDCNLVHDVIMLTEKKSSCFVFALDFGL